MDCQMQSGKKSFKEERKSGSQENRGRKATRFDPKSLPLRLFL